MAELPATVMAAFDRLPEGEYAQDELTEALAQIASPNATPNATPISVDEPPD